MTYLQRYFYKVAPEDRTTSAIAFFAAIDEISKVAPSVSCAILAELRHQRSHLKLIASENYSSLAVQLAMGNLLTDKYAEGVPFHRFYAGCENVDTIESEGVEELKLLFNAEYAYIQPHSGADANLVAYWAIITQRVQNQEIELLGKKSLEELTEEEYERIRGHMMSQKVLGMSLSSGGHLTHGYRHNISGKMMRSAVYDVDPRTGLLDYNQVRAKAQEVKPLILVAGYSSYPRKINFAVMREIADSVGAVLMVDMAHFAGLVAGKVFQGEFDPVPYADIVTSTTHKTLRGPRGGFILCKKEFKESVAKGCPLVLGGPLPHVMAAKVVAFKEAGKPCFRSYAERVVENAQALADELQAQGALVLTGGTDNHLVVVDVRPYGLNGRQAEGALTKGRLTLNRNTIPNDPNGPWYTSGLRFGTAALTTLGMGVEEMRRVAKLIVAVLKETKPAKTEGKEGRVKTETSEKMLSKAHDEVASLLRAFPLYPELDFEHMREALPLQKQGEM